VGLVPPKGLLTYILSISLRSTSNPVPTAPHPWAPGEPQGDSRSRNAETPKAALYIDRFNGRIPECCNLLPIDPTPISKTSIAPKFGCHRRSLAGRCGNSLQDSPLPPFPTGKGLKANIRLLTWAWISFYDGETTNSASEVNICES